MSPEMDASLSSAATWSSARLRSRSTLCAASWSFQKLGSATRASRDFRRSRYCGASKIAPHERDALLQSFVTVLQVFENHAFFLKVVANRITETSTQSQANQSPKRVYSVLSVRKS